MPEDPSYVELSYAAVHIFSDSGVLDVDELNFLLGIAMRDSRMDALEKQTLGNILGLVSAASVDARTWARIQEARQKHSIPASEFAGPLTMADLNFLMGQVLMDGKIDDEERHVLRDTFDNVSEADVSPNVWARIQQIRGMYGI